ncbi:DUF1569 domain-containing protein [Flavobacterium sp. 7A]|uniref:DUF1569 domain-containing protein n=1 Tax=Flavobacterium sp. 7A TaxID=2940571 RepID=UPI0022260140|nr:DUF1569 domain-containing protein [Flavobacterium sp. 7A]MCW2118251.1 hypothetical protein [Flavobacterium sp. 7A]
MKNIFDQVVVATLENRINELKSTTKPNWGKMEVAQMLAHCNVTYELVYEDNHPKVTGFKKWLLKTFVKKVVVNEKPFSKNGRTAPMFMITVDKDFLSEKTRLLAYLNKTQKLGRNHFEGKESNSFGVLNQMEWNNMFYKHLDHHLTQFGV